MPPRIRWRLRGFREIRTSEAMDRLVLDRAQKGADACGEGYVAAGGDGDNRARAALIAASPEARIDNAENHTLLGPGVDAMKL